MKSAPWCWAMSAAAALVACGGGSGASGPDRLLVVTPESLALDDCGTAQLVVALLDADGEPVPGATFGFTSTPAGVAAVSAAGAVTATGAGTGIIVVSSGGRIVNIPVTVAAVPPVLLPPPDSLQLWPAVADTLAAGLRDCRGASVAQATFTSNDPAVATATGAVVRGVAYGTTAISWTIGTQSGQFPVRVIGRPAGSAVTSVALAGTPYGVAVTSSGRVLVTQIGGTTVATGQLPGTTLTGGAILVGTTPPHVTVNPAGTRAFVTNQTGRSVSVVDLLQNLTVATVPLGGDGFNLLMTRDGSEVYVTTDVGLTYILDGQGAKVDSFTVGPVSNGLAEHPTLPLMYISARDGPSVTVYDRQLHAAVDTFVTGGMPQRMAVSPDGAKLYIANETLGLDIWNTVTGQRIESVAMPAYGLALSPDGTQLLVTSAASTIRLVDTATLTFSTLVVGGITRNATYEASGRTALVTDQTGMVHFLR